ncbi:hypothetical protein GCM10009574_003040 [Streptomyces asiaticus]|uniref:Uncharacterized protein n=2 Tax=Streptomyces rhizosphaericus TaxID=114699 RepID=A0ABP4D4X1_9ACTN
MDFRYSVRIRSEGSGPDSRIDHGVDQARRIKSVINSRTCMDSLPIISRTAGRDDIREFGTAPYGPRNAPGKHTPAVSAPRPDHTGTGSVRACRPGAGRLGAGRVRVEEGGSVI